MFESFFGLAAIIGLIATVIWLHRRLSRMEREHKALLSFVLSSPQVGPSPLPGATAAAQVDTATSSSDGALAPSIAEAAQTAAEPSLLDVVPATPSTTEAPAGTQPAAAAASVPHVAPRRPRDVETALGTRWAVWVGGLALALGGVFLVRYSIEAGWFGPAARLIMAAAFGLVLLAGGEFIRRTGFRVPVEGAVGAFIPAILTAAGAFTLFAAIYAAHGIYGFVGPATAFTLLGLVAVVTMAAALLHGQALGGLGLLGSLVTPILVSSDAPSPWALFGYLAIVLGATVAVARLRRWSFLAAAAFSGVGLWTLLYLGTADYQEISLTIILFISVINLAILAVVWLGDLFGEAAPPTLKMDGPSIASALFVALSALVLCSDPLLQASGGLARGTVVIMVMVAVAYWQDRALPLVFGAGFAAIATFLYPALSGAITFEIAGQALTIEGMPAPPPPDRLPLVGWLLAALFLFAGIWKSRALVTRNPFGSVVWAGSAAAVPVVATTCLWITFGNLDRDAFYAVTTLLVALLLVGGAEWVARAEDPPFVGGRSVSALLAGAGLSTAACFHMAFGPGLTTMLLGAAAVLPALATRYRIYPALGWLTVGAAMLVLVHAGIDPTIIGASELGATPVFNALLPGYGIPALAFGFAAWQLARTPNGRPRLAMEVFAVLFALLTIGMLVRHAMNGGVIHAGGPSLAEQAIYTLMAFGAGAILLVLDRRAPSLVMNYGSIAFGVLSVVLIVLQHFLALNPLFTDESTGRISFFNLIFLAYLLPAATAAGLALYARGKRPNWYPAMLGLLAAVLAFAYATLSVRRWFHGEFIALWRDMTQLETYTYSALWLLLGVLVLIVGVLQQSHVLRIASAVLIAVAVAKVFLFDMSELEGVLRALSFIGLGAVLIGIGLFYQKLLTRHAAARPGPAATPPG